jgi:AIPR protein
MRLPIDGDQVLSRVDSTTGAKSWLFSMRGDDVGRMYREAGIRLFSRNIRGYLGSNDINHNIEVTLRKEPGRFWYFNNGLTIVCESARKIEEGAAHYLHVTEPQVINGQQTTYSLRRIPEKRASVLVRVLAIPRDGSSGDGVQRTRKQDR